MHSGGLRDALRTVATPGETLGSQYQSIDFNGSCKLPGCRVAEWQRMWDLNKSREKEKKDKCGTEIRQVYIYCVCSYKDKSIDMISSLDHYLCSSIPKGNPTPAPVQLQLQTCYKKYSLRPGREVGICR